jgi:ABC-type transport system substrate-binding protein
LKSVAIDDAFRLEVDLRSAFVMPQAVLQAPLHSVASADKETGDADAGAVYVALERTEVETRYGYNPNRAPPPGRRPAEVIERPFSEAAEAIAALEKGEIDAIDRLYPADALRLPAEGRVRVGAYATPTLHVIVPNRDKPFTKNLNFRRALLCAINREAILKQGFLAGGEAPGCRVISGPFPAGVTADDPMGYAYDERIAPRDYNPLLSSVLVKIAENEVIDVAARKNQPAPKLGTLTLCHPATEAARVACSAIVKQFDLLKLKCQLVALPPGQTQPTSGDWDLLYAELAMFEPLVDAERLMGKGGLAFVDTPHVRQVLRDIESATSWSRARGRLRQLHAAIHEDVSLLPLYQVAEWYAHRPELAGIGESPAWFYQNLAAWRTAGGKDE